MSKFENYKPLFEEPTTTAWKPYTVAWVIQRYIDKMDGTGDKPGLRPLGSTKRFLLKAMQRMPICAKDPRKWEEADVIEHAEWRRETCIPATVNQDLTYLFVVLKYAKSAWKDCKEIKVGVIEDARPMLKANGVIGKSAPRKRIPTDDELDRLIAHFTERDQRSTVKMVPVILFALASTRRRGEIVRLQWGDIEWDLKDDAGNPTPMYMIRDLKHPTKKIGNHKRFPLFPELAAIIMAQPRLTNDPTERVFPYNGVTVGALYTEAKKELGIEGLRFHDNRRHSITRWLKVFSPYEVKQISGHETTVILERVYAAPNPAELHAKLPARV